MSTVPEVPRHQRNPGDEGYRTPTIEDAERHVALQDYFDYPSLRIRRVHTSALESLHDSTTGVPAGIDAHNRNSLLDKETQLENARLSGQDEPSTVTHLPWKQRIRHVTWAFYTLTMATGGIANALYQVPYRFTGLETIGVIVFLFNIALFVAISCSLAIRFYYYPYTFKASLMHPTESLFVPASVVSFGTILINISQYGPQKTGPWLNHAVEILYWIDAALAVIFSAGIYLLLWSTQTFTIAQMTPVWIFPAYPMLIIGPHAGVLSAELEPSRSLTIIIGGTTIQGVGFMVSLMVYSAFIYRLMTQKLPKENVRPGMFVSVGPSAFTVSGIVTMAAQAKRSFPVDFMGNGPLAADILRVVVNFASLWLWGLALFFFFIAAFAHLPAIRQGRMIFTMGWYSFVFPNTALTTATFAIGKAFTCKPIEIIGCVMIFPLILMYIFVFCMMIRAIYFHHILWPQKGEDKDEGGFEMRPVRDGEQNPV